MKTVKINRRNWLRSSLVLGAGAALSPTALLANSQGYNKFTGEYEFEGKANGLKAKLNANENPYGPSAKAVEAFKQAAVNGNLYPFEYAEEVKAIIAKEEGVTAEQIFLGSGSSEILTMTGLAFGADKGALMSAFPTFRTMLDTAVGIGGAWQQIPLDSELKHDLPAMKSGITKDTKLVYICNPNNPTGTVVNSGELRKFCTEVSTKVPVFVDEAYTDFMDDPNEVSMIDLIHDGRNIIIARTFSKIHGMAGLRVGYGIAQPDTAKMITAYATRLITVSGPSLHAAMASYKDEEFKKMCKTKNKAARDYTFQALQGLGFSPVASNTSFMIFTIKMKPEKYLARMEDKGVGVRSWVFEEKVWCRVSIGTMDEMKTFIGTLEEVHAS
jgi:histidinol-phosphate aminotransferase